MSIVDEFMQQVEQGVSTLRFDKGAVMYEAALEYLQIVDDVRETIEVLHYTLQATQELRHMIRDAADNPKIKLKRSDFMKDAGYRQLDQLRTTILQGEEIKRLYAATFNFQRILNKILDQNSVMVYVQANKGRKPRLIQIEEMDVARFGQTSDNQLRASFTLSQKQLKDLGDKVKVLDTESLGFDEESIARLERLQITYQEVVERLNIAISNSSDMVLWYLKNTWYGMRVPGRLGDINEAYASFMLLNNKTPTFDNGTEQNVEDYMMDPVSGVGQVDNASGLLQGDVSKDGIEYAIKSAGASALGLLQIEKLARKIVNQAGQYKLEDLKEQQEAYRLLGVTRDVIVNEAIETRKDAAKEIANAAPANMRKAIEDRINNFKVI